MSFSNAVSLFTVIELIRFIGGSERGDYIEGIVRHPLVVQGCGKTGITGDNGVFMEGLGKSLSVRKVNRIVVVDNVKSQCKRPVILITFLNSRNAFIYYTKAKPTTVIKSIFFPPNIPPHPLNKTNTM